MGSGSSARKTAAAPDVTDGSGGSGLATSSGPSKYKVSRVSVNSQSFDEDTQDSFRPCDRCGETRKTARFGGENAEWLCAACQLDSGAVRQPRRIKELSVSEAPRPLRRSQTCELDLDEHQSASAPVQRRRRGVDASRRFSSEGTALLSTSAGAADPLDGAQGRRSRRAAKERALSAQPDKPADGASPPKGKLSRSNTVSLSVLEERHDYRSAKGLNELREQMGVGRTSLYASEDTEPDSPAPKRAAPSGIVKRKKLPGGYHTGDRVSSLISRVRGGLLVLELGHEGTVVAASSCGEASTQEIRLLVQFDRGFDWLLPPCQICPAGSLASAKSAGLPRFTWGTRVRSLATHIRPGAAKREVWLGDPGTVIGPGRSPGKLAVRFDDCCSEWSIWPTLVCEADSYTAVVQEKLVGGLCRGDRVRASCRTVGVRSCGSADGAASAQGPHGLEEGEEGTVVGPGHSADRLLVHFDSDERLWSIPSAKLVASAG